MDILLDITSEAFTVHTHSLQGDWQTNRISVSLCVSACVYEHNSKTQQSRKTKFSTWPLQEKCITFRIKYVNLKSFSRPSSLCICNSKTKRARGIKSGVLSLHQNYRLVSTFEPNFSTASLSVNLYVCKCVNMIAHKHNAIKERNLTYRP